MEDKCEYNTEYRSIAKKSSDFEDGKLIEDRFDGSPIQTYTRDEVVSLCYDLVAVVNKTNNGCVFDELDLIEFLMQKLK